MHGRSPQKTALGHAALRWFTPSPLKFVVEYQLNTLGKFFRTVSSAPRLPRGRGKGFLLLDPHTKDQAAPVAHEEQKLLRQTAVLQGGIGSATASGQSSWLPQRRRYGALKLRKHNG